MSSKLPNLTDHQLEIMKIVWENPDITVIEVTEKIAETRQLARNTVQTMLTRLAEKGWLEYRKVGNTFRYSATQSRNATARSMLARLADRVFDGSAEALVSSLVDGKKLSPAEARRIKKIIDDAEKNSRKRKNQ